MSKPILALAALALAAPTHAQHADHAAPAHEDHSQHAGHDVAHTPAPDEHGAHAEHAASTGPTLPPITAELRAAAFPDLSAMDVSEMMLEDPRNRLVLLDRLEAHDAPGDPLVWDFDAWFGRTLTRVWIRSEGERRDGDTEHAELELLWGKGFARWWDVVAGARRDFEPSPTETWAAFGVRGLAPYRFDIEATLYVADGGSTAFRFDSEYQILITNRLILEPQLEINWYGRADRLRGVGAGLADAELGLRLRYEIRREVAPYVGLVRERTFGTTADLAAEDRDDTRLVAGIRLWF